MAGGARGTSSSRNQVKSLSDRMAAWKRRKETSGVDWREVDITLLRAALHAIVSSDCAVMFAQARGGEGVMVKIYDEGAPASEFAANATEMDELLESLVHAFSSKAEDVIEAMRSPLTVGELAAD